MEMNRTSRKSRKPRRPPECALGRRRAWASLLGVAVVLVASGTAVEPAEIFRRAVSLEEYLGRVEIRRSYGARLQVLVDCETTPRGCPQDETYDEVTRLDFFNGRQLVENDQITVTEDPIGTIYLATTLTDHDRLTFHDEMDRLLHELSANAFDEPFAGWGPSVPPFDKPTLSARSLLPSWACFEFRGSRTAASFRRWLDEASEAVVGLGLQRYTAAPTSVCQDMRSATENAFPDIYRTLASPRRLLELSVDHEDVVRIDADDPSSLLPLPDGVRLVQRPARDGVTAEAPAVIRGEVVVRATSIVRGVQLDAWAEPARIPIAALDSNAWLHAWTIRTVERTLGIDPRSEVVETKYLLAAFLPTVPAEPAADSPGEPGAHGPARIDRPAFLDRLAERLERHSGPPRELIAAFVRRPPAGLVSDGWLVVVCGEGSSATYHLPPTRAAHRVTNAELFCDALEMRMR